MLVTIGNIFESKAVTLVNTINCVGVMGKGVALEFKKRYPQMFHEYAEKCKNHEVKAGCPYYYHDLTGTSIINFPTKEHWRSPSKLSYIIDGLDWFVESYQKLGITSVAFPPLGCGNGGLSWEIVGPIMYNKLKNLPIAIEIYAPFGTKPQQLKKEFLELSDINCQSNIVGAKLNKLNSRWNLLLYVVQQLSKNRYSLNVGRTIFQKICYVLTRNGVNTGFVFSKGAYGPYSAQINEAIMLLSNANLIQETSFGRMMKMSVSKEFDLDRTMFSDNELLAADKTIDLFSRVKNTDQAEMIATVLYAYDSLDNSGKSVSDIDVYRFVMNWKKHWETDKKDIVCDTIQNLTILRQMNVLHSNEIAYNTEI